MSQCRSEKAFLRAFHRALTVARGEKPRGSLSAGQAKDGGSLTSMV
jgi:hypothetical protein